MELNGKTQISGRFPQMAKFLCPERRQAIGSVGVNSSGDYLLWIPTHQWRHAVHGACSVSKKQARALQALSADLQTMFQVAMVVLIGFRVDNDSKIDVRIIHTRQQMFGSRLVVRAIRGEFVVWKPRVRAAKAVQVSINDE